jgi:2-polyprenyl-6-methoxyphenol hydroxylase-like FAD-dependent oxidoreductase
VASIVITGGGAAGLISAMLLADDSHEVLVLERDRAPAPAPADAWESWARRGVNQFRLLHFLLPRFRREAQRALPRVVTALEEAGALRLNIIAGVPDDLTGGPRPGDDELSAVTARRPVAEAVFAACAEATPGVTVRRGVAVAGLTTGAEAFPGAPHVTGVRTEEGEEIPADLVIDATGRRSALSHWIEAAGGRRPTEEVEDSGFVYYGRHFRSDDGTFPPIIGPLLQNYGSLSVLTLPADNGTWGMAIVASAADKALRAVRDVDVWTAVMKTLPLAAHWLDGRALDDTVAVMAKIEDRHRRFVVGGEPVVTGVVALADSWACTNPSLGRGISMGTVHALALRDLLRASEKDDPARFARAFDEATTATVEPWYRATVSLDRHRLADIDAEIRGETYRTDDPGWEVIQSLQFAAGLDPDCFRAFLNEVGMLERAGEAVARPELGDKVIELGAQRHAGPRLGPTRQELLDTLTP